MKIAQRFSAGWEPGAINKSVKRTTERYRSAGFRLSRPLRGLYKSLCPRIPPMNQEIYIFDSFPGPAAEQRPELSPRRGFASLGNHRLQSASPVGATEPSMAYLSLLRSSPFVSRVYPRLAKPRLGLSSGRCSEAKTFSSDKRSGATRESNI